MDGWVVDAEVGRYTDKGTEQRLLWGEQMTLFQISLKDTILSLSMLFIALVLSSIFAPFPFLFL